MDAAAAKPRRFDIVVVQSFMVCLGIFVLVELRQTGLFEPVPIVGPILFYGLMLNYRGTTKGGKTVLLRRKAYWKSLSFFMANDPFTIRIFVPDGDPEGVRLIDRMNWTGLGIVVPRERWLATKQRLKFSRTGVYILAGQTEGNELPTVYVGEAREIRTRIDTHFQNKDFWDRAIVFTASNNSLNTAHAKWLEHALVGRALRANRSILENGTEPQEPALSEAECADTQAFLREVLQILPLVGLRAFEIPAPVARPQASSPVVSASSVATGTTALDTIVVPAQPGGFEEAFIGENCWYAIRISGGMLPKIKYIAAYRTQPESAVTHYAPVASIAPYGEQGKYKLLFAEPAKPIGPIPFADAPSGSMQAPRYTSIGKLLAAKKLSDLFG